MIKDLLRQLRPSTSRKTSLAPENERSGAFPLDPESPWPKFRGNGLQNGRAPKPMAEYGSPSGLKPWEFKTGKGIFSSPVIDRDGTVYIGSADHYFYAISAEGRLKWRYATNEIIDSSALLDDRNRVYFGSGDGHVHCLDRDTGDRIWRFAAHSTAEVREKFGINTHNLNWFEGNTAVLPDGTLLAPNDNYLVYALDRDTGELKAQYPANEMVWSCPAVNPDTGRIFFASCFNALVNIFCYDSRTGRKIWTAGGMGSISASPLLTSARPDGAVLVGGFDGILRALSQKTGKIIWTFGARDHIYGSPAQLSSGIVVQAACDGTVYGLDPATGRPVWSFDTPEPIRSSPVVDGQDRIYFGTGQGRLYCLAPDGTFSWAYTCIEGIRNDLNGSPALGRNGIVIAGENGSVFFVPHDWPLTREGREDPRSVTAPDTGLARDGSHLYYVTPFGRLEPEPPAAIAANEPLMLSHITRKNGRTLLSAIDAKSLKVTLGNGVDARVALSANKKFITLIPKETWTGPEGGLLDVQVQSGVRTGLRRLGLKFFGGKKTHQVSGRFRFKIPARQTAGFPYQIPKRPGDPATVFEFSRLSCPSPTMLPSYNQIGFDSLHYLAVLVGGDEDRALAWVVPGRLDEASGNTLVDPGLTDVYVMEMDYRDGLVTFYNYHGFAISFVGSWDMPFGLYRIAAQADPVTGDFRGPAALNAVIRCDDIRFYGRFLKLTGMSDMRTGLMHIAGGTDIRLWDRPPAETKTGEIKLSVKTGQVTARFSGAEAGADAHVWGLILVDPGSGRPLHINYARKTQKRADSRGQISNLVLDCGGIALPKPVTVLVMQDTCMVFRQTLGADR